MATRRSKLRVMPNIGPKISKTPSKPAEVKKPTTTPPTNGAITKPSAEKVVLKEKTLPVLQDSVEKQKSEETIGLTEKGSEMLKDVEMVKSPVNGQTDKVKASPKPDAGPLRANRNRLPKAKPNISSIRGAARPKVNNGSKSPVKVFSPDRQPIKSPVKSPVAGLLAEENSTQQSLPSTIESCEQDENVPVTMENMDSVDSSTAGLIKPAPVKLDKSTSYKADKNRPSRKQRTANMKQFPEDAPPDRQKMKMVDMIYWNPTSNPMKQSAEKVRRRSESITVDTNTPPANTSITETEVDAVDNNDESTASNDAALVPQVTIGPDGSMIINEQSLVVETEQEKETLSPTEIVEEDDMFVNYNSFRNKTTTKTWLDNETARFYRALSALGTDFSLMSNLFPHRTRRELKNKFKREERFNRGLVDKAMLMRIPFSLDSFESIESVLEKDRQEREARKKASHKRKKTDKQGESGEKKAKKSRPIVESDIDEEMPEEASPKPKPKRKSKKSTQKMKEAKPKSVKEKKSSKKTVKGDKEVNDNATKKQQSNNSNVNEIEEYRFESSDEEDQVPSRLPKLKKPANFTEFHNTAAQKLQESFSTRPPSEEDDDDEDDEEEEVDVLASDSDVEDNANTVSNSQEKQGATQENQCETQENNDNVTISESQTVTNIVSENVSDQEQTIEKSPEKLTCEAVPEILNPIDDNDSTLTCIKEKPQSKSTNLNDKNSEKNSSPEDQMCSDIVDSSPVVQNKGTSSTSVNSSICVVQNHETSSAPVNSPSIVQNNKGTSSTSVNSSCVAQNHGTSSASVDSQPVVQNNEASSAPVNTPSVVQNKRTDSTSVSTIAPPKESSQPTRAPVRRLRKFQPNLNLARKKTTTGVGSEHNSSKAAPAKKVDISKKVTVTKKQMNNISRQEKSPEDTTIKSQGHNENADIDPLIIETSQVADVNEGTGSPVSAILNINNTQALPTQLSCDVVDINMGDMSTSDLNISYSEEEIVTTDSVLPVQNVEVIENNNANHFVLPANVFPNMPFTQDVDKMQMILVPETKNGDTIYHVYMVPENSNLSEAGQTTLGTSSEGNS